MAEYRARSRAASEQTEREGVVTIIEAALLVGVVHHRSVPATFLIALRKPICLRRQSHPIGGRRIKDLSTFLIHGDTLTAF
jgi:hypothetical protein